MSTVTAPNIASPTAAPPTREGTVPVVVHVPVVINGDVEIPGWVVDHESFRRWAHSDDFPETGRYSFIDGKIWADRTMEEFFSHNQVKSRYTGVLDPLVLKAETGYFGADGNLWTNVEAGISTEPDGLYFSYHALQSGRVRLIKGKQEGYIETEGSPNMTLEVVSNSSEKKDKVVLKDKCAKAGVDEYWLVDCRQKDLLFQIWRLQDGAYVAVPAEDGWLTSTVFGRAFKLQQDTDPLGHPRFQVLVR